MSVKETIVFFEDDPDSKRNSSAMQVLKPAVKKLICQQDVTFGQAKMVNDNDQRWELIYDGRKIILDMSKHNTLDVSGLSPCDVYFVIDTDGLAIDNVINWINSPLTIRSHPPQFRWLNRMINSEQIEQLKVKVIFLHPNLEGLKYQKLSLVNGSIPWVSISVQYSEFDEASRNNMLGVAWIASKQNIKLWRKRELISELSRHESQKPTMISAQFKQHPYSNSNLIMPYIKKWCNKLPLKCKATGESPIGAIYLGKKVPDKLVVKKQPLTFPNPVANHLVCKEITWGRKNRQTNRGASQNTNNRHR